MTNTNLLQAMGRIDPKLIADAAPDVQQKKNANKTWVKWASLAACLAIVICAIPLFNLLFYKVFIISTSKICLKWEYP